MTKVHIGVLVLLGLPAGLAAQQPGADQAARTIVEADYARRIAVIADDSMGGRDTPSDGLEKTALWIASQFREMGLRGGAEDGGFLQRYPVRSMVVDRALTSLSGGARPLTYGQDMLPLLATGEEGAATGGLALVSGSRDVSRGLADAAVRGQHAVLVLAPGAAGVDQNALGLVRAIRNAGAASVLVTVDPDDALWDTNARRALLPSVQKGWEAERAGPGGPFRPIYVIRTPALRDLLAGLAVDLPALQARSGAGADVRVDRVSGLTLTLTQRMDRRDVTAPNVVGILDGSDPTFRSEYVAFSAHMDHVGIGLPNQDGDSIYNGADDDASGTTAVVEIAEAMSSLPTPPKRSILFLLVSGEEKGLWGSEYFTDHPTVPIESLVADLNTDMVGRNWPDTIVAIGKEHSDLGETLARVNAAHPELGMTAIDDLWPEENFYRRSDHYNFARKGVPILFFFNGTHEDYHGLDDEVDRINAEKAARIARLVFYLGLQIADTPERPQWNPDSYASIVEDRGRSRRGGR